MIRIQTLSDLSAQQALYVDCISCDHSTKLNLIRIINSIGDLTFDQLRTRLRCKNCGSKHIEMLCVWEGNDNGFKMPRM